MTSIIVKIMAEVLNILALSTIMIKKGRAGALLSGDSQLLADPFQNNFSRSSGETRSWKMRSKP
jgi:hypothetical protein